MQTTTATFPEPARRDIREVPLPAPRLAFGSKETQVMVGHLTTPLVGIPEQIVEGVQQPQQAGIAGMAMDWVDDREGNQQFAEQIGPLMVDAGLRRY
jgi:alkanesulfonate monooxygenase SsuD/methylene tetrahydromethanopterin reductase-like flavin-dependent oxidoreductase (luciferase family)